VKKLENYYNIIIVGLYKNYEIHSCYRLRTLFVRSLMMIRV